MILSPETLDSLLEIALDLSASLSGNTRYQRLIEAIRKIVPSDASAILRYDNGVLIPVAIDGLSPEILGKRFYPNEHPRLKSILESRVPISFPADDPRPDPYDGLVDFDHSRKMPVHSCMGCSLYMGDSLVGVLTLDALKLGVFDQVDKSKFATFAKLAAATIRTAHIIDSLEEMAEHRSKINRELVDEALKRSGDLKGKSDAMLQLINEVNMVAQSDLSVLITGDTGVGKELVARTLHAQSLRQQQPLVYINCAALPETLAESELFGHVKGSFTGATRNRAGKFELADRGTLFLDEIGELPLSIQAKLLRVLQSGEVQRVGGDKNLMVDVRILAATNRHLDEEVKEGRFRSDLYHRLSVYPIHVPPLRERDGDIPILANHFIKQSKIKLGCKEIRLTKEALQILEQYKWPGNIREFEHVLIRAALRAGQGNPQGIVIIDQSHLGMLQNNGKSENTNQNNKDITISLKEAVEQTQKELISKEVESCDGNWSKAAENLQVDRSNLYRMAKRLGIK
ncbi:MAG: anaerobic nitric oxide reductase transcription regulator [bacterium]|jgi:anaerobic nitric oxide reductase transcription regulator